METKQLRKKAETEKSRLQNLICQLLEILTEKADTQREIQL